MTIPGPFPTIPDHNTVRPVDNHYPLFIIRLRKAKAILVVCGDCLLCINISCQQSMRRFIFDRRFDFVFFIP